MSVTDTPSCFVCGRKIGRHDHVRQVEHRGRFAEVHNEGCLDRFRVEHDGMMDMLARQFERARAGISG
jgi:hypothetical protein